MTGLRHALAGWRHRARAALVGGRQERSRGHHWSRLALDDGRYKVGRGL